MLVFSVEEKGSTRINVKRCFATKKNLGAFVIKNRMYSEPDDPMVIFPTR